MIRTPLGSLRFSPGPSESSGDPEALRTSAARKDSPHGSSPPKTHGVRLQKFLADAGIASRRAAERLITSGQVSVNGRTADELGIRVDPARDSVSVDGRPVRARRKLYVALNKPVGFLCTRRDPAERRIVTDLLPKEWSHLFPVGRLDRDSEGLLFLTNDGDFSLRLTHPRYGITKRYRVIAVGRVTLDQVASFTQGVQHEGETLRAERVKIVSANASHSLVEMDLRQGKNHEVRRLFESIGRPVESLRRVQIGPIKLGQLPVGRWRVLTEAEVKSLLRPAP
ncbi:MAG: rRNA pseudouridine synthase [Verrucomicrobiales bacterium]|nr:rRNA pseudouridine synthase [Verrucomicrobiales bacterium]